MSVDPKPRALKAQIEDKIQKLLAEFSEGKLNRDQFHTVYQRYTGQLEMIEAAISTGNPDLLTDTSGGISTVSLKREHMAKAVGLRIFANVSTALVETLGEFEVPQGRITSVLNEMHRMRESGSPLDKRIEKVAGKQWLLYTGGKFTTIVTLFHNEPSQEQIGEMKRLLRDFEDANRALFQSGVFDASKLAYPFLVFVQRKLKSS